MPASIENDELRAVQAAAALLRYDARATWERLQSLMSEHPKLMKEACLRLAGTHYFVTPDLGVEQLGQLYSWLEEQFPQSDDPHFEGVHAVGPAKNSPDGGPASSTRSSSAEPPLVSSPLVPSWMHIRT